jgi:uncharacterized Zn ribbon protein
MKTNSLAAIAMVASVALVSCSNDDFSQLVGASDETTIYAEIVGGSRSDVTKGGVYSWTAGDAFDVWSTNSTASTFKAKTADDAAAGKFTGSASANELGTYATYPTETITKGDDNCFTVTLASSYGDENTGYVVDARTPMIGVKADDAVKYSFKHLGAAVRIAVNSIPVGVNAVRFSTIAGEQITGNFAAATVEGAENTFQINVPDGKDVTANSYTIKFAATTEDATDYYFIVPVPVGTYEKGFKVEVLKDNDAIATSKLLKSITLQRAHLGLYPELTVNATEIEGVIQETKSVSTAEALKDALESGRSVKLTADVDIRGQKIVIPEEAYAVLDLNGQTLTAQNNGDGRITVKGTLKVKDSGENGTIKGDGESSQTGLIWAGDPDPDNLKTYGNGKIILESGTIDATCEKGYGIVLRGGCSFKMTGGTIKATCFALSGNGNDKTNKAKYEILGGHLESTTDYAVYLPHLGETTISGDTEIVGYTGAIAIQNGDLTVDGGSITANGVGTPIVPADGDGTNGLYFAAICQAAGYDGTSVTINGGTIKSLANAVDFNNLYKGTVSSKAKTTIVNGGNFSDLTFAHYLVKGKKMSIELAKDITETHSHLIKGDLTLDLNGKTISTSVDKEMYMENGNFEENSYKSGLLIVCRGAKLTINDSDTNKKGTINSTSWSAITLIDKTESNTGDDAELVVNQGNISGHYYAITGNGVRHGTKITINDGTFTASTTVNDEGLAIYHPQDGTLTIKDGTFKGTQSGIELRSGTLNITGGNFISTGTTFSTIANNNGTTTTGSGLVIAQHTTGKTINVSIENAKFETAAKVYNSDGSELCDGYALSVIKQVTFGSGVTPGDVNITIKSGTFEQAIYSNLDDRAMVDGGSFKADPKDYLKANRTATLTDGYYVVK